jgi:hypothetical protein
MSSATLKDQERIVRRTLVFVATVRNNFSELTVDLRRQFRNAKCEYNFFVQNNVDRDDAVLHHNDGPYISASIWAERGDKVVDMLIEIDGQEEQWLIEGNINSNGVEQLLTSKVIRSFDELDLFLPSFVRESYLTLVRACVDGGV